MKAQEGITVSRHLPLSRRAAWEWLTDSGKTAKWYGPYTLQGGRLTIRLIQEEGQPEAQGELLRYEQESLLLLRIGPAEAPWDVTVRLDSAPGGSLVTISQPGIGKEEDPWIIAGWSFYLDCLLAAVNGEAAPKFEDYVGHLKQDAT